MNNGRKWPKPVKTPRTTTVIPTTQSERQQQQLQRQRSQKEQKKKKIGNVIDSLRGTSLLGTLGGGEVVPQKKEEHHKKQDPEPAFPIGQMVTSNSQYTVETDKGGCCGQRLQFSFEFSPIEFYRIYRIYRICRKLFLIVLKMKITKNNILQIL